MAVEELWFLSFSSFSFSGSLVPEFVDSFSCYAAGVEVAAVEATDAVSVLSEFCIACCIWSSSFIFVA